jgi:hypothetical protein
MGEGLSVQIQGETVQELLDTDAFVFDCELEGVGVGKYVWIVMSGHTLV